MVVVVNIKVLCLHITNLADLLLPEKRLTLPDGENMIRATSTSHRTESS